MFYNISMNSPLNCSPQTPSESASLSAPQLVEMVGKLEHEVLNLRRQVACFQRQIFGQKSEKRVPTPDPRRARWVPVSMPFPVPRCRPRKPWWGPRTQDQQARQRRR